MEVFKHNGPKFFAIRVFRSSLNGLLFYLGFSFLWTISGRGMNHFLTLSPILLITLINNWYDCQYFLREIRLQHRFVSLVYLHGSTEKCVIIPFQDISLSLKQSRRSVNQFYRLQLSDRDGKLICNQYEQFDWNEREMRILTETIERLKKENV